LRFQGQQLLWKLKDEAFSNATWA